MFELALGFVAGGLAASFYWVARFKDLKVQLTNAKPKRKTTKVAK